jgi:hypothetical protein
MSDFPFRLSSVWFNSDEEDLGESTDFEVMHGSDRSAAIVAGALVEDHLTDAIKRTVASDTSLFNELFSPERGMLGSFGAKIRIGFLIGLYDRSLRLELDTISRIRNRFAHRRGIDSFASEKIKGLVANLTAGESLKLGVTRLPEERVHLRIVYPWDDEHRAGEVARHYIQEDANPRQRFIATCIMFIWFFSLMNGPPIQPFIRVSENKDAP